MSYLYCISLNCNCSLWF